MRVASLVAFVSVIVAGLDHVVVIPLLIHWVRQHGIGLSEVLSRSEWITIAYVINCLVMGGGLSVFFFVFFTRQQIPR